MVDRIVHGIKLLIALTLLLSAIAAAVTVPIRMASGSATVAQLPATDSTRVSRQLFEQRLRTDQSNYEAAAGLRAKALATGEAYCESLAYGPKPGQVLLIRKFNCFADVAVRFGLNIGLKPKTFG